MSNPINPIKMIWILCVISISSVSGQTITNGFFPEKNDFAFACSYSYESFENFYMGNALTLNNRANIGEIYSSTVNLYGEHRIVDWFTGIKFTSET